MLRTALAPLSLVLATAFATATLSSPAEGADRPYAPSESYRPSPDKENAHTKKPDAGPLCPPGWRPATPPLNPALGCLPGSIYVPAGADGRPDIPQGRCPDGWQPLTPPQNPMLICQPKDVQADRGTPRPGRVDPFCPDGWKAVTPPLNRALICLPDRIIATLPPSTGPDVPAGRCPEGWWRVTAPLNPVLGCLPDTVVTP